LKFSDKFGHLLYLFFNVVILSRSKAEANDPNDEANRDIAKGILRSLHLS